MKKGILTFVFAIAFLFTGIMGVNAAEYTENSSEVTALMTGTAPLELKAGDTVTLGTLPFVGKNGYVEVKEGTLTISKTNDRYLMTVNKDSVVEANHEKNLMYYQDLMVIDLSVEEGATLDINGGMALTSGHPVTLTNNGTINVNGNLEIRTNSHYTGTGAINVFGNLAVYGVDGSNIGENVRFNIYENGNVYSETDLTGKLISGLADNDEYTYKVIDNNKTYTSISPDVNVDNTFEYGYTLNKTAIEKPAEEIKEEPVKDETENPKTSDGIMIAFGLLAVSIVTVVIAKKKLA